jgi:hypothetical protein
MEVVSLVFAAVYLAALAIVVVLLLRERGGIELHEPLTFRAYRRLSSTRFLIFGKILRITVLNLATAIVFLCLIFSAVIAAVTYTERGVEVVQHLTAYVDRPIAVVKLAKPYPEDLVTEIAAQVLPRNASLTLLYRSVLDRGLIIEGVPGVKWVVVGISGSLAEVLNLTYGVILTGCRGNYTEVWVDRLRTYVRCADEGFFKLRLAPLETLLPVLGYLGAEPITPSPDMVLLSDTRTIARVLDVSNTLITDVVIEGLTDLGQVKRFTELLEVDSLYYYSGNSVTVAGFAKVITTEALVSAVAVLVLCVVLVTVAYRSLIPKFRSLYETLLLQGLPPWGMSIAIAMHIILLTALGAAASSILVLNLFTVKQALVSAVVCLLSGTISLAVISREVGAVTLSYGAYTPVVERHELLIPISGGVNADSVANMIRRAFETNEFFDVEVFEYKAWGREIVVHCRAAYREMWGVAVSSFIGITLSENLVRVFISVDVSSVEELSESLSNSIKALVVSKVIGSLKVSLR